MISRLAWGLARHSRRESSNFRFRGTIYGGELLIGRRRGHGATEDPTESPPADRNGPRKAHLTKGHAAWAQARRSPCIILSSPSHRPESLSDWGSPPFVSWVLPSPHFRRAGARPNGFPRSTSEFEISFSIRGLPSVAFNDIRMIRGRSRRGPDLFPDLYPDLYL